MSADHRVQHDRATALGRRFGPGVAAVGVLGALATLLWVTVAPDNVVGEVSEAPFVVPATLVVDAGAVGDDVGSDCVLLVDGSGTSRRVCPTGVPASSLRWDDRGRLRGVADEGEVVVDPVTGDVGPAVTADDTQEHRDMRYADLVTTRDRQVVDERAGDDHDPLLDLGGPRGRLIAADRSPSGEYAVAVAADGRVLVARTDAPRSVYVWTRVGEDEYGIGPSSIRWEE